MATSSRVWQGDSEASINAVNQAMRAQPWYQAFLASIGQSPDAVQLSKAQSRQLLRLAQANGVQVDEGHIEVDPGGNFNPKGHKLRNTLIGVGIGGAAALTGGAALGAFGGAGAAVPALEGGATLAANLGTASALPAVAGAGAAATGGTLASLGGGSTLAATPMGTSYVAPVAGSAGVNSAATGGGSGMGIWDFLGVGNKTDAARTGLNLVGNYLQSRQVNKAVDAQTAAAEKALELQRGVYMQQRADLAPARSLLGVVPDLLRMTGSNPSSDNTLPMFQPPAPQAAQVQPTMRGPSGSPAPHDGNPNNAPVTGQAVPRTLASLGGSGFVAMIAPDGRQAQVPQAQVQAALAAGGRMA